MSVYYVSLVDKDGVRHARLLSGISGAVFPVCATVGLSRKREDLEIPIQAPTCFLCITRMQEIAAL